MILVSLSLQSVLNQWTFLCTINTFLVWNVLDYWADLNMQTMLDYNRLTTFLYQGFFAAYPMESTAGQLWADKYPGIMLMCLKLFSKVPMIPFKTSLNFEPHQLWMINLYIYICLGCFPCCEIRTFFTTLICIPLPWFAYRNSIILSEFECLWVYRRCQVFCLLVSFYKQVESGQVITIRTILTIYTGLL